MNNRIPERDFFGSKSWYTTTDGNNGPSSIELASRLGSFSLDLAGIKEFLLQQPKGNRTCFAGISMVPAGHQLTAPGVSDASELIPLPSVADKLSLIDLLTEEIGCILKPYRKVGLALSGGVDSALLLACIRNGGFSNVNVYTFATDCNGYCEKYKALSVADYFRTPLTLVQSSMEELVENFPGAIQAAEVPLYNLHPVSRWILARAMVSDGMEAMLTGDAADQAFSGVDARNYIPIVGALVRNQGLDLLSPFLLPRVISYAQSKQDPVKSHLRRAAASVLPEDWAFSTKIPRLTPPLDISHFGNNNWAESIARKMQHKIRYESYEELTLWASLYILFKYAETRMTCVV